ncbi:MAG: PHP-associated domain-containing protein [Lachnospiraceae bacterium]|nr:hypothetical protein [Lachnospiraceae bacterium]MDY2956093.1 PHP-associated domain-containing protein [Lachnospiraceae bacterium]
MSRELFDMHCHSREGSFDAHVPLSQYASILKEKGFTGMVVTDHDSYKGYYHYHDNKDIFPIPDDFVILKGIEYDTRNAGHILVIMPDDVKSDFLQIKGLTIDQLEKEVHGKGGIIGCAHPFMPGPWAYGNTYFGKDHKNFPKKFDFIETYNSTINPIYNLQAEAFASYYDKLATGGSDAHVEASVGRGFTQFPEGVSIKCNNDLIAAIKGKVETTTGGSIVDKVIKDKSRPIKRIVDAAFWVYNRFGANKNKGLLLSIINGSFIEEDFFGDDEDARNKILKYAKKLKKQEQKRLKERRRIIQKALDRGAKPSELKLKKKNKIHYPIKTIKYTNNKKTSRNEDNVTPIEAVTGNERTETYGKVQ